MTPFYEIACNLRQERPEFCITVDMLAIRVLLVFKESGNVFESYNFLTQRVIYETVFVFLCQLIGTFSVLPCDQHLSLQDGTPLVDDSKTLADLGVRPGCVLLLKVCHLFALSK